MSEIKDLLIQHLEEFCMVNNIKIKRRKLEFCFSLSGIDCRISFTTSKYGYKFEFVPWLDVYVPEFEKYNRKVANTDCGTLCIRYLCLPALIEKGYKEFSREIEFSGGIFEIENPEDVEKLSFMIKEYFDAYVQKYLNRYASVEKIYSLFSKNPARESDAPQCISISS